MHRVLQPAPAGFLRGMLGRRLLASCEAAIEYWMALAGALQPSLAEAAAHPGLAEQLQVRCSQAWLPRGSQMELLQGSVEGPAPHRTCVGPCMPTAPPGASGRRPLQSATAPPYAVHTHAMACAAWPLPCSQAEVEAEVASVQRFVDEREVEAPESFQAIQSYRQAAVGRCWQVPACQPAPASPAGSLVACPLVRLVWAHRGVRRTAGCMQTTDHQRPAQTASARHAGLHNMVAPCADDPARHAFWPAPCNGPCNAPVALRRAAMAVLRQQAVFAHTLYQSGGVDEGERDEILEEVGRRERQLEITGAPKAQLDAARGTRLGSSGGALQSRRHQHSAAAQTPAGHALATLAAIRHALRRPSKGRPVGAQRWQHAGPACIISAPPAARMQDLRGSRPGRARCCAPCPSCAACRALS